jgi:hypothetical protein
MRELEKIPVLLCSGRLKKVQFFWVSNLFLFGFWDLLIYDLDFLGRKIDDHSFHCVQRFVGEDFLV